LENLDDDDDDDDVDIKRALEREYESFIHKIVYVIELKEHKQWFDDNYNNVRQNQ
jgi:hypothetical protein